MEAPDVRYAVSGDVHIAYQVVGDGPLDLVYVAEFWNSIEAQWEEPRFARFLQRLASFSRLICFDQRGKGLSDPVALTALPTLEQWMEDVRVVMQDVGSERAALLSVGGGGMMSMLFAATHPGQTEALVLLNSYARLTRAADYPWGTAPDSEEQVLREMRYGWGRGILLDRVAPSMLGDHRFRAWWARYQRLGSSPGTVLAMRRMIQESDVRWVLPSIHVPTLVVHRRDNWWIEGGHGRYLAEHIPGAGLVEAPGLDYFPFVGDADAILDPIQEFLTGAKGAAGSDRILATVLFTDIVGSTELAARLGDRRWRELLETHNDLVRRELARFHGREVNTAGDGFLSTFDGPARAVHCALAIRDTVRGLGLDTRAGLHTGEIELVGDDIGGIAVHIGARIAALAAAGQVLLSSTVKDLVAGSGIELEDRGVHQLKGVPGEWRLYAVRGS
ncbi:MAG TPA: adenylate/guanylate cyclase domain-containing protein [Actinomycetota bacterium]|nr:adenylate/guanylate cyclase domain-containing protein [Actinomycetota bacterium]